MAGKLQTLCASPRVYQIDGFLTERERKHILSISQDKETLSTQGITSQHNHTGSSFEMPVEGDILEGIAARIYETARMENDLGGTMRFRLYAPGEYHPLHFDSYLVEGSTLIVTAMLYLTDVEEGGETHFPFARPAPIKVKPKQGRLLLWFGHNEDGSLDPRSAHESLAVIKGEKSTLTNFIYRPALFAGVSITAPKAKPAMLKGERVSLYHISESHCLSLRESCEASGIEYIAMNPDAIVIDQRLPRGALLYRQAPSAAAIQVERLLCDDSTATLYTSRESLYLDDESRMALLARSGLPVIPRMYCTTSEEEILQEAAEQLGGFPVRVEAPSYEVIADSLGALRSLVPLLLERDPGFFLSGCARPTRWDVLLSDTTILASSRHEKDEVTLVALTDKGLQKLAVSALRAAGLRFGQVTLYEGERTFVGGVRTEIDINRWEQGARISVTASVVDLLWSEAVRLHRPLKK